MCRQCYKDDRGPWRTITLTDRQLDVIHSALFTHAGECGCLTESKAIAYDLEQGRRQEESKVKGEAKREKKLRKEILANASEVLWETSTDEFEVTAWVERWVVTDNYERESVTVNGWDVVRRRIVLETRRCFDEELDMTIEAMEAQYPDATVTRDRVVSYTNSEGRPFREFGPPPEMEVFFARSITKERW